MTYRLVKGTFRLVAQGARRLPSRPDGDSVWFVADDPSLLADLGGRGARLTVAGCAQLRFEAIDALELHWRGTHQKLDDAIAARDFTLGALGFRRVEYTEGLVTVRDCTPPEVRGHILAGAIDPYGRPVSFVFAGASRQRDGADARMDVVRLADSVNAALASSGQAFAGFYTGLAADLRDDIAGRIVEARRRGRGMWRHDATTRGAEIAGAAALEEMVLWPKLFRRLAAFFAGGHRAVSRFGAWLREDPERDDSLRVLSGGDDRNLHDVIEVAERVIRMTCRPEEIVVVPR
jgi:hypothetical protein